MENQNNNSSLKIVILVLLLLLLGSVYYNIKLSSEASALTTEVKSVKTEKETVMNDLRALKDSYDKAIAENTTMSDELIAEREKVVGLMAQLEKSKVNALSLSKYKEQFLALQTKMNSMLKEVDVLKKQNQTLKTNLDSTNVVLTDSKNYNQVLVGQNEELSKTVEKGSKLSILNLKTATFKLRSSGKKIETDKASRVDVLKVSFTIAENSIAKSGDKTYYVQIIDSKNNVLGDKVTVNFGDKSLTYSFTAGVKYENKTVDVVHELPGKDFASGTYYVNLFDKNQLVTKSSFTLR
jgi:predicted  nucleic acid-binding Zn-ribbon protein